jgi:hypothetical protein
MMDYIFEEAETDRMSDASRVEYCPVCGQKDIGQTGEYPCEACGLPHMWDDWPVTFVHGNGCAFGPSAARVVVLAALAIGAVGAIVAVVMMLT